MNPDTDFAGRDLALLLLGGLTLFFTIIISIYTLAVDATAGDGGIIAARRQMPLEEATAGHDACHTNHARMRDETTQYLPRERKSKKPRQAPEGAAQMGG
jgi:hypothetical protein